jgi:hypothetical protein
MPRLLSSNINRIHNLNVMYVTGQATSASLARALVCEVRNRTPAIIRECVLTYGKLDQIILAFRKTALPVIMRKYGTFIQLPHLGATEALVRVQGASAYSVDRTIAELMSLCCEIYEAEYWAEEEISLASDTTMSILASIAASTGCTFSMSSGSACHAIGLQDNIRSAAAALDSKFGKPQHINWRVEVPVEHKDFIVGRKSGKIQRVTQGSNSSVAFEPFSEHNFYVNLHADTITAANEGLGLLEDELPYETNLYIHESYHKQVIGAGGERILGIMKRSQVFIKFDVPTDRYPNIYSYHKPDNVVIRCPSKNAKNINQAIADLRAEADDYSRQYSKSVVRMSRSHRRLLLRHSVSAMQDIELKTGAVIGFPDHDTPMSLVDVCGIAQNAEIAARMLTALFPGDYEFKVTRSSRFTAVVSENAGEFYDRVIVPLRIAYGIEIQVDPPTSGPALRIPWRRIVLSYAKSNAAGLDKSVEIVTAFLREFSLDIIDRGDLKHTDFIQSPAQPVPPTYGRGRSLTVIDNNTNRLGPSGIANNAKHSIPQFGTENNSHLPYPPSHRVSLHSRSQSAYVGDAKHY